jgi:hypothetical protein
MQFIQGNNRHQIYCSTLEDEVCIDNPAKLIVALVSSRVSTMSFAALPWDLALFSKAV